MSPTLKATAPHMKKEGKDLYVFYGRCAGQRKLTFALHEPGAMLYRQERLTWGTTELLSDRIGGWPKTPLNQLNEKKETQSKGR